MNGPLFAKTVLNLSLENDLRSYNILWIIFLVLTYVNKAQNTKYKV